MVLKNSLNIFIGIFFLIINKLRTIYLNSKIYNNKISKISENTLNYRPSLDILSCLFKYENKPKNINEYILNSIWKDSRISKKESKKLNSFFWLFTLDLKSSKKNTQSVILNWIDANQNYTQNNWEVDTLSRRIIAWISNSKLTYEESSETYKTKFNFIIKKQINHLINEINRSQHLNDKMIGCTAIVLAGISYDDKKILDYGLNLLKNICNISFDTQGFPKSRNFRQLVFYLKFLITIREFLKESQNIVPDYLNEHIFYLGQSYNFIWQTTKKNYLFNGNHKVNHETFDRYLLTKGYKFKNKLLENGGYALLKNKNVSIMMDIGQTPEKKFCKDFQSGALSFEMFYAGDKIISNSGYFQNLNHRLNFISRSTVSHSTLTIDNSSICKFKRGSNGNIFIENNYKTFSKKIIFEKNYWSLKGSHDGYHKKYGVIHSRELEFFPEAILLKGKDILLKKKKSKNINFEIRFHFSPETKVTKTQNEKSILLEFENSGWRFTCNNYNINVETGFYFGNKNKFLENQNVYISGNIDGDNQTINWELKLIK